MCIRDSAYVAFAAQNPENYTESLELEKRIEQFEREWEQQPEYRQLRLRGDWRVNDRVKYDAENERLTQMCIRDSYDEYLTVVNIGLCPGVGIFSAVHGDVYKRQRLVPRWE